MINKQKKTVPKQKFAKIIVSSFGNHCKILLKIFKLTLPLSLLISILVWSEIIRFMIEEYLFQYFPLNAPVLSLLIYVTAVTVLMFSVILQILSFILKKRKKKMAEDLSPAIKTT